MATLTCTPHSPHAGNVVRFGPGARQRLVPGPNHNGPKTGSDVSIKDRTTRVPYMMHSAVLAGGKW